MFLVAGSDDEGASIALLKGGELGEQAPQAGDGRAMERKRRDDGPPPPLLIDAGRVAPAESIVTAIAVLEKDPAQDVREAATALRLKIGRLTTRGGKTAETAAP